MLHKSTKKSHYFKRISILWITVLFLISNLMGCGYLNNLKLNTKKPQGENNLPDNLKSFKDYDEILKILKEKVVTMGQMVDEYYAPSDIKTALTDGAESDLNASSARDNNNAGDNDADEGNFSETNVQVKGVDEGDIIKTDGEYIYVAFNDKFLIADVRDPENMKILYEEKYGQDNYSGTKDAILNNKNLMEMFLDRENERVILIFDTYYGRMSDIMLNDIAVASPRKDSTGGTSSGLEEPGFAGDDTDYPDAVEPGYVSDGNIGFDVPVEPGDVDDIRSGEGENYIPVDNDRPADIEDEYEEDDIDRTGSEPAIGYDDIYNCNYYFTQSTYVQILDVSDKSNPLIIDEITIEGSLASSRKVNEYLYLVINKNLYFMQDQTRDDSAGELLLPAYKQKGKEEWELFPASSILAVEASQYSDFLVVTGINIVEKDREDTVTTKAILGGGNNVYATPESIYISVTEYDENVIQNEAIDSVTDNADGNKTEKADNDTGIVVDGDTAAGTDTATTTDSDIREKDEVISWEIITMPEVKISTDVFKFSIDENEIEFLASGKVPGYILNQFAMDEQEGYFRIATTTGDSWRVDEFASANNLYVLDGKMEIVGRLEGLAATETIKSVRFMGDKAYMVTFRLTDPLYVIDLSEPTLPKVEGELKIPGYSQYLHPVNENILLGFGMDTGEIDGRSFNKGFKVSVFDVSDAKDPKEVSTMIFGDQGTYSDLSWNHKALLFSLEKNLIGFPINIYSQKDGQNDYYLGYKNVYMVLGFDDGYKLVERAGISHINYEEMPFQKYPGEDVMPYDEWLGTNKTEYDNYLNNNYNYMINRGLYIGDNIFTISNGLIKANSMKDFSSVGELKLIR